MDGYATKYVSTGYNSCIKIDGRRILSPLIDDEYRAELLHYKHLAVLLENRRSKQSKLNENRCSVDSGVFTISGGDQTLNNSPTQLASNNDLLCETLLRSSNNEELTDIGDTEDILYSAASKIEHEVLGSQGKDCTNNQTLCYANGHLVEELDFHCNSLNELKTFSDHEKNEDISNTFNSILRFDLSPKKGETSEVGLSNILKKVETGHILNVISPVDTLKPVNIVSKEKPIENLSATYPVIGSTSCVYIDIESDNENSEVELLSGNIISDAEKSVEITNDSESCVMNMRNAVELYSVTDLNSGPLSERIEVQSNDINNSAWPLKSNTNILCGETPSYTVACKISSGSEVLPVCDNEPLSRQQSDDIECLIIEPVNPLCRVTSSVQQMLPFLGDKHTLTTHIAENESYSCLDSYAGQMPNCSTSDIIELSEGGEKHVLHHNLETESRIESFNMCANDQVPQTNATSSNICSHESKGCFPPMVAEISTNLAEICNTSPIFKIPNICYPLEESGNTAQIDNREEDNCSTPTKFVRRNSYTLEAPSPELLAHLEAQKKCEKPECVENKKNKCIKHNRKGWNLVEAKANWVKNISDSCSFAVSCKQSQAVKGRKNSQSSPSKHKKHSTYFSSSSLPSTIASSPVKSTYCHGSLDSLPPVFSKTHQRTPSRTKWSPISSSSKKSMSTEHHKKKPPVKLSRNSSLNSLPSLDLEDDSWECDSDGHVIVNSGAKVHSDLKGLFTQMQFHHSRQMAELLTKQKLEQEAMKRAFLDQQKLILSEFKVVVPEVSSSLLVNNLSVASDCYKSIDSNTPSTTELAPTIAARKPFFSENSTSPKSCSTRLIDLYSHKQNSKNNYCTERIELPNSSAISSESHLSTTIEMSQSSSSHGSNKNNAPCCSRQLFQSEEASPASLADFLRNKLAAHLEMKQKERAATIINAAARGYLIRRLMRTEYIQERINTITDTVHCAMQLQQECPVDLRPSDVELHRRLIQQLTAACHSLHDTFFMLSIPEKMAVIAADRERLHVQMSKTHSVRAVLSVATQRTLQRKQMQIDDLQTDRSLPSSRKVWSRNKGRASSTELSDTSPSCVTKQSPGTAVPKPQRPTSSRFSRQPWR